MVAQNNDTNSRGEEQNDGKLDQVEVDQSKIFSYHYSEMSSTDLPDSL